MRWMIPLFVTCFVAGEDITTLDGKTYKDVLFQKVFPEGPAFTVKGKNVGIPWAKLPSELVFNYRCEEGIVASRTAQGTMKLTDAFSLAQLEDAKKKAIAEGKPLGFIMVWGQFFDVPAAVERNGGSGVLMHFHHVFKDQMVLVFVRHETELGSVPPAVGKGFNGPDEGGFAPNMAVVDPKAEQFIVEIPMGGKDSTMEAREKIFRDGIEKILAAKDLWMKQPSSTPEKKK